MKKVRHIVVYQCFYSWLYRKEQRIFFDCNHCWKAELIPFASAMRQLLFMFKEKKNVLKITNADSTRLPHTKFQAKQFQSKNILSQKHIDSSRQQQQNKKKTTKNTLFRWFSINRFLFFFDTLSICVMVVRQLTEE